MTNVKNYFADISNEQILDELRQREAAGAVVGALATESELNARAREAKKQQFDSDMTRFMSPDVAIEADEQLSVMANFWKRLGFEVPELTPRQRLALGFDDDLAANPLARLVPAPLIGSFAARSHVLDRAKRNFPKATIDKRDSALIGPYDWVKHPVTNPSFVHTPYAQLIADPTATIELESDHYALRYFSDDEFLDRVAYVTDLIVNSSAVEASDGTVWTFAVLRQDTETQRLDWDGHPLINPALTPETLIAWQALGQASGRPPREPRVANEFICKVNDQGLALKLLGAAHVQYLSGRPGVHIDYQKIRD